MSFKIEAKLIFFCHICQSQLVVYQSYPNEFLVEPCEHCEKNKKEAEKP